jgi:hypothetical protein
MRTWADLGAFGRGRVPVVYPQTEGAARMAKGDVMMGDVERWVIWKAVGHDDDVICGPGCHGVDVAPVDELMAVRRQLRRAAEAIRKAPHASHCEAASPMWPGPCNCWKRERLDPDAA